MSGKPEPWWPLQPVYIRIFKRHAYVVRRHPTVHAIVVHEGKASYWRSPPGAGGDLQAHTDDDMIVIRCTLLRLAYPEGDGHVPQADDA